jgi:aminoglycoside N3'-acetyltransferase
VNLEDIKNCLVELIPDDDRPIVVFASIWPFLYSLDMPRNEVPNAIVKLLLDYCNNDRDLLMPTFAHGFRNGVCNLDHEKSSTGLLSEVFRLWDGSNRSLSSFFPYNIIGPATNEVISLLPENAWGDGSVCEWMEKKNAQFLMLGTHMTHCSYLHRVEWLAREYITYRYIKKFEGTIIYKRRSIDIVENLYVRSLSPEMINDFTVLKNILIDGGMRVSNIWGIPVATMSALEMKAAYLPALIADPLITVKNRMSFGFRENNNV